jgi:hypothetical protein
MATRHADIQKNPTVNAFKPLNTNKNQPVNAVQ